MEGMRRTIMENGGQVVQADVKANYVIFEDGFDPNIWKNSNKEQKDSYGRFIVHFRWVEECIRKACILEHIDQLHLCPLPVKVPCQAFDGTTVEFTLAVNPQDTYVMEKLCALYGVKHAFKE